MQVLSASDLDHIPDETSEPFRGVAIWKFLVMTVATFGLYEFVWFYRNWKKRLSAGDDVFPLARAWFHVVFFPALVSRVRDRRLFHDLPSSHPATLGALYIGFTLSGALPGNLGLFSVFAIVPVLMLQFQINDLNRSLGYEIGDCRLSLWSWSAIFVGALAWLLVVAGLVLPEQTLPIE